MKTSLILFLLLAFSGATWAQTNLVSSNGLPAQKTIIESESGSFDNATRLMVYLGNVRVTSPELHLKCERLVVGIPEKGQRLSRLTAETNVVIDYTDEAQHDAKHITSNLAVYDYRVVNSVTNWTVTFTGTPNNPPVVVDAMGTIASETITWNGVTRKISFDGKYRTVLPISLTDTNSASPMNFLK